jgi:5-methylcytosine-specific restriction protein A
VYLSQNSLCRDPFGIHGKVLVVATVVDHIQPHKGDYVKFWDVLNWQPLCRACHARKTAMEDGGYGNQRTHAPN